jgi:tetratricopeptide (TPR) repeat protein/DNA-binding XRE family transcriptional regulator
MDIDGKHPLRVLREQLNLSIDDLARACGVSSRTILRAEQWESLSPGSRRQICHYLQKSPEDLGLLSVSHYGSGHLSTGMNEMQRRELLRLLSVTGGALVLPIGLNIDWDRLGDTLSHPSHLTGESLEDYAAINRQLWWDFRAASQKEVVLGGTLAQIRQLQYLLNSFPREAYHQQLCLLLSDVFQLAGEVCFDSNLYTDAAQCYSFAQICAREANAYDLWACALTRHAFLPIYDKHYQQALPLLQMARRIALLGDSQLATRYWVAAVTAEAEAGAENLDACHLALDLAEGVRGLGKDGANGAWLRFTDERLSEERGACFVRLRQPTLAEPALQEALKKQPASHRRRGLILTDLALVAIQRGDAEKACEYGDKVIEIARQSSPALLLKGLQPLLVHLQPVKNTPAVKSLSQQIKELRVDNKRL